MAKKIEFRKIYGCPKHGKIKGTRKILRDLQEDGTVVEKPCFCCDACNKVYLEPTSGSMGKNRDKLISNKYTVWYTIGPYSIPSIVYVYDSDVASSLCSCEGKVKEKTRTITHFLLKNGTTESVPGVKVCRKCKKVFDVVKIG